MQALIFVTIIHELRDDCPFFGVVSIECDQLMILLWTPCFNLSFLGVQMLLPNLHVDLYTVKTLDWLHKLADTCFFHYFYYRRS
jgi:hypothetical protein